MLIQWGRQLLAEERTQLALCNIEMVISIEQVKKQ